MTDDPMLDPETYQRLRKLAYRIHAERRGTGTLQPTALLHEAWVKVSHSKSTYKDRSHFLAIAARAMRQILVDNAKAKGAAKAYITPPYLDWAVQMQTQ